LQTLIEDAQSERASSNKFHEEKVLVRSKDLIAKFNEQTQQLQEYQMNLLLECRLDPFVGRGTYKQQQEELATGQRLVDKLMRCVTLMATRNRANVTSALKIH
jgi:hypothetical protein